MAKIKVPKQIPGARHTKMEQMMGKILQKRSCCQGKKQTQCRALDTFHMMLVRNITVSGIKCYAQIQQN